MEELTAFQRDLLRVVAGLDNAHGLDVKNELEVYYDKELNHGRLYPNLDTLAEKNLIDKEEDNGRANIYEATKRGMRELEARDNWNDHYLKKASKPSP